MFLELRQTFRFAFSYGDATGWPLGKRFWSDSQDAPNRRSAWGNALVYVWVQRIGARTDFGHVGGTVAI